MLDGRTPRLGISWGVTKTTGRWNKVRISPGRDRQKKSTAIQGTDIADVIAIHRSIDWAVSGSQAAAAAPPSTAI